MSSIDPAIPESTDPWRRVYERIAELFRRLAVLERRWGYEPSRFAGELVPSSMAVVPAGYLAANGQGVTTANPDLRNAYIAAGSPHGTDGLGNPRVPDYNSGWFIRGGTPGGSGGASSHAHGVNAHSHGVLASGTTGYASNAYTASYDPGTASDHAVINHTHGVSVSGATDAPGGSTDAQSNLPPFKDAYWLVKT